MRILSDVPGLRIVEGQVGSGKSAYAVLQAIEHAKLGLTIYTNLAIRGPRVAMRFGQDIADRIHYFRDALEPADGEGSSGHCWCGSSHERLIQSFHALPPNSEVFVDEAHHYFRSGKTPTALEDALKRQRHQGVNVWMITPDAQSLPAAVRRVAARIMTAVDLSVRPPLFGFIPYPAKRVIQHRMRVGEKSRDEEVFQVSQEYLDCYDTTGGTIGNEPRVESLREVEASRERRIGATIKFWFIICGIVGVAASSMWFGLGAEKRRRGLLAGKRPKEVASSASSSAVEPVSVVPLFYPCPEGEVVGEVEGFMVIEDGAGRLWVQMSDGCHPYKGPAGAENYFTKDLKPDRSGLN